MPLCRAFCVATIFFVLILLAARPAARAANDVWDNNPGGNWETGANWTDGSTPGTGDTATFNLAATYPVTFGVAPTAIQALTVSAGTVTFQSSGGAKTLNVNSGGVQDVAVTGASTVLTLGASLNPLNLTAGDDLSVQSGATLNVVFGSDVVANDLTANGLNGTLLVNGSGSSLTLNSAAQHLIANTLPGSLLFQNSSTGNSIAGGLRIADNASGVTGSVSITGGSAVTMGGSLALASQNIASQNGSLTINSAGSSLTQSGASTITVGATANGTAAINIGVAATGGTLTTGSGLMTINETGTVTVGSGANTGSLIAGGDITIDGGLLQFGNQGSTYNFNFHTMNIQNGGRFAATGFRLLGAFSTYNVTGVGSELSISGAELRLNSGNEVNVSAGGAVSTTSNFNIAISGGDGTLTVAGSGSSATTPASGTSTWGSVGDTATVTFRDNATGVFGNVSMANGVNVSDTGSVALVTVESGADVSFKDITMASAELSPTSATLTVTGAGSSVTLAASEVLTVGHSSVGSATVNVLDGGALTVGAGGSTILNATGTINIDGGTADLKTLTNNGGIINFTAGALSFLGNLTVGTGGVLGANVTLDSNQQLTLSGATTVNSGRTLTLNGGTLSTSSLVVNGAFHFDRGILALTSGTISGLSNLTVPSNGEFRASGVQALQIIGLAGSTITATGNLTVGDATNVNGFYSNGTLDAGANSVTLADANDAVFDSAALVTIGDGGSPGTLAAANGLTLDFGGNVTGFGTINTPNSAATPFINNGHIAGNSGAQPITLTGYVKGVGTLDNVVITGTDAPGFSPATVVRGSVAYDGTLQIEIGGTSAGSFDQINHVLGAGMAQLGGTLDVDLLGGFVPAPGNTFQIITATGGVSGTFSNVSLPGLSGANWQLRYNPTSVLLQVALAGDYNFNGVVDAADYVVWRKTLGQTGFALAADGNVNGQIDADDYNVWRSHFGQTLGLGGGSGSGDALFGVTSAVPEPASIWLVVLAAAAIQLFAVRRRNL